MHLCTVLCNIVAKWAKRRNSFNDRIINIKKRAFIKQKTASEKTIIHFVFCHIENYFEIISVVLTYIQKCILCMAVGVGANQMMSLA